MLLDILQQDLIKSLKAGEKARLSVLRMVISEIKNRQIDMRASGAEMSDKETIQVMIKEAKKRKDSIEAYESANRLDLADIERNELVIIESYLPSKMSEEEIKSIVNRVVSSFEGDSDGLTFGVIMKKVMAKIQDRADGKVVSEIVKRELHSSSS